MLPEIKLGGTGMVAMSRRLGVLAEAIGDMTPIWRTVVHPWFLEHMKQQFETSGAHGGKPWEGYGAEPKYAAYKQLMVGHLRPLVWEIDGMERLRPSLVFAEDEDHYAVFTPSRIELGTMVPYAARLVHGGTGPFKEPYPGRAILAMSDAQKKKLITLIQRDIQKRIGVGNARFNL